MMNKIKSENYGIIHLVAYCQNCNWSNEDHKNPQKVRNEIRKHILKTGHEIIIETGLARKYYLSKKQRR